MPLLLPLDNLRILPEFLTVLFCLGVHTGLEILSPRVLEEPELLSRNLAAGVGDLAQ